MDNHKVHSEDVRSRGPNSASFKARFGVGGYHNFGRDAPSLLEVKAQNYYRCDISLHKVNLKLMKIICFEMKFNIAISTNLMILLFNKLFKQWKS